MLAGMDQITLEYNKGTALLSKGNWKKALPILRKCSTIYPCKEVLVNLGNCYRLEGNTSLSTKCYKDALNPKVPQTDPKSHLHAMNNYGLALYSEGKNEEAIATYTKAIEEDPKFWECWWNCSTATLRKASSGAVELFPRGWEMYNARFLKSPPVVLKNNRKGLNYWVPREKVKNLVVLTEQGLGDSLMFGRYISRLREYADEIYVQAHHSLHGVFSDYKCIGDATEINCDVEDLRAYPICSLGGIFGSDIPAGDWLADKFKESHEFPEGFNVGIVWSGSSSHTNDRYRSTNVERFHRLSKYCNLYSLSPDFKGSKYVKPLPIKSWDDTAKYIKGLDLVIGVDTSVMHMVGSLGCEGWLLQPMQETDFRWGIGVSHSVWYSDIRVFENPRSWDVVFDKVEDEISRRKMG